MQHVVLVQPREQQLAAEAVVVADAGSGDGEAEDPVEDHRVLHHAGALEQRVVGGCALGGIHRGEPALDRDGLAERGEVAAQLLDRVEEDRNPLLDHERVDRQVAAHVRAVVDEVPHHEGLLREPLVVEQAPGVVRQLELRDLGGVTHHAAEAGGLAVGEDRAPREARDLAHRDGLGEQHRGVGVVPGREVDEADGDEQRVAVVARLQLGHELRPDDLDEHGLDEPGRAAVLRGHREDDEVPDPVHAVALRLELVQGVEEVGHAEARVDPAREVHVERREVGGVVREERGQRADGVADGLDQPRGLRVVCGVGDRAVLDLHGLELDGGVLEGEPGGGGGDGRDVLDDLGLADDGCGGCGAGHGSTSDRAGGERALHRIRGIGAGSCPACRIRAWIGAATQHPCASGEGYASSSVGTGVVVPDSWSRRSTA